MGTNDVLSDFNHPLQSPPVLVHAQTMPVCNVSSQDAFNFLEKYNHVSAFLPMMEM